jgi:nucleoid DNA-binding protein
MMSLSKRDVVLLLIKQMKGQLHNIHIFGIVQVFIEEMIKELKDGRVVLIPNFFSVRLEEVGGKTIRNVKTGKIEKSKSKNKLRVQISRRLAKRVSEETEKDMGIKDNGGSEDNQ